MSSLSTNQSREGERCSPRQRSSLTSWRLRLQRCQPRKIPRLHRSLKKNSLSAARKPWSGSRASSRPGRTSTASSLELLDSAEKKHHSDERCTELSIRNTGKETVKVDSRISSRRMSRKLRTSVAKPAKLESIALLGRGPLSGDPEPGGAFVFCYFGWDWDEEPRLLIGPSRSLADTRYGIRTRSTSARSTHQNRGRGSVFTTGAIESEVAAPPAAKASAAEDPFAKEPSEPAPRAPSAP